MELLVCNTLPNLLVYIHKIQETKTPKFVIKKNKQAPIKAPEILVKIFIKKNLIIGQLK